MHKLCYKDLCSPKLRQRVFAHLQAESEKLLAAQEGNGVGHKILSDVDGVLGVWEGRAARVEHHGTG